MLKMKRKSTYNNQCENSSSVDYATIDIKESQELNDLNKENKEVQKYIKNLKIGNIITFMQKNDKRKGADILQQGRVTKIWKDKFCLSIKKTNRKEIKMVTLNDIIQQDFKQLKIN